MKGLQHAPATLCCWFTTTNTQDVSTRKYPDAPARKCEEVNAREKQIVEKLIHALQENLEPALLSHGWLANGDQTPLTDPSIAQYPAPMARMTDRFPADPASSSTIVTRLDVPGVALALQLSPPEGKRSAAQQVETQLHFGAVPDPFGHPGGSSFVIDMEVHITATRQVTEELLKMVDWQRIGGGLAQ